MANSIGLELFFKKMPLFSGEYTAALSVEKAAGSESLHIAAIKRRDPKIAVAFISYLLKEFLMYVPHNLNNEMVAAYADKMSKDCSHWKPEDFIVCLNSGLAGDYGKDSKIYGYFTYATFNEWKNAYDEKRDYFFYLRAGASAAFDIKPNKLLGVKEKRASETDAVISLAGALESVRQEVKTIKEKTKIKQ